MKALEDLRAVLQGLKAELYEKYQVKRLGLYGLYTEGQEAPESEVDILVELEEPIRLFRFLELQDYLSERLGVRVGLVTPGALSRRPVLLEQILREAHFV